MARRLSIKQNILWNSAGSLINLGCLWLVTVFVVRLSHGYDDAGTLSLAMAIANVFQPIAQFKMRAYQVSDVEHRNSAGEYVAFRLITTGCAFAFTVVYAALTSTLTALPTVTLFLAYKAIDQTIDCLHGVDQQHGRMDYCGLSYGLRGILSLAAFCAALSLTGSLALAVLAMVAVCCPVFALDWRNASQFESLRPHITARTTLHLASSCAPAVIGTACCAAIATVARQHLAWIEGTAVLGIYASVCTPIVIIQAGSSYVYAPLLGPFAELLTRRDAAGYLKLFARVTAAFGAITLAGCVAFFFLGKPLLALVFKSDLAQHADLMQLAILSTVLCAYASFLCDQLIAARTMAGIMVGNALALAACWALSPLVITQMGANGTSAVTAIAYALDIAIMLGALAMRIGRMGAEDSRA